MSNDIITTAKERTTVRSSEDLDQLDDCTISTVKRSNITHTNHPVSLVYVQEQNSLASDLTTSNATANSNQTASMSLNVEQFPSLEAFYSVLCNAAVGNSGLQLRDTVEESVQSAALSLLPEYVAGNGCIAPDRMASSVQGIQRIVENFQSRNIGENENTIFVINEFLIEWAIKSTIVKKMNLLLNGLSCQPL